MTTTTQVPQVSTCDLLRKIEAVERLLAARAGANAPRLRHHREDYQAMTVDRGTS